MKYLKKEIKSRPTEKISNIVMNAKESLVEDNSKAISLITACISIIVPLIIFTNPVILYEKCEGGYGRCGQLQADTPEGDRTGGAGPSSGLGGWFQAV